MRDARNGEVCKGIALAVAQAAADAEGLGHALFVTETQLNIFMFCSKCWAYGSSQPRQLTFACPQTEVGEARAHARRRISKGVHPKLGTDLGFPVPFAELAKRHRAEEDG